MRIEGERIAMWDEASAWKIKQFAPRKRHCIRKRHGGKWLGKQRLDAAHEYSCAGSYGIAFYLSTTTKPERLLFVEAR